MHNVTFQRMKRKQTDMPSKERIANEIEFEPAHNLFPILIEVTRSLVYNKILDKYKSVTFKRWSQ